MKTSRKQMSLGLIFAAGTLVGAVAVFVPLTLTGHPGSNVEGSGQRPPGAVRSAAGAKAVDADSASSMKQDSNKSNESSNESTCDVQLD